MKFDAKEFLTGLCKPTAALPDVAGAMVTIDWPARVTELLATIPDSEGRADLVHRFDERAAICEYDGNLSRSEAARIAYTEVRRGGS